MGISSFTEAYEAWRQRLRACQNCALAETRTQVVTNGAPPSMLTEVADSYGDCHCPVFLLGEAPGGQEDLKGIPFCGQAGGILNSFLQLAELDRQQVYISNMVKCRPVKPSNNGRYGSYANRKPTQKEIRACAPWLREELALIRPRLLVTLGNVPLSFILGKNAVIGEAHGKKFWSDDYQVSVYPLYHPAALLYDRSKQAAYEEDVVRLGAFCKGLDIE